jgi:mannose-1-phosphate guanylyltransferase
MLKLGFDRTLFQMACDRLDGLFPPERILVVTSAEQAVELQKQVPQIPPENYLLEPMPRGTAAVVGFAAAVLKQRDPTSVMAVLTADHLILNVGQFQKLLRAGYQVAQKGYLVTLGITPTAPSTGYGYIQRGKLLETVDEQPVYEVLQFKEKPSLEAAEKMIAGGDHDWNSGMFIWRLTDILDEFSAQMPGLANDLKIISAAWGTEDRNAVLNRVWQKIEPQTIDYGIMEHARRVAVLPADNLGWNDVGSWESLYEVFRAEKADARLLHPLQVSVDSKDLLIISEVSNRLIATIGVEDLVIIDTEDVLLVCKRQDAQKVREVVQRLNDAGLSRYL